MSLSGLPANELARIDAVCLEFESQLRRGLPVSIEQCVARYGGSNAELLRRELEAVRAELGDTVAIRLPVHVATADQSTPPPPLSTPSPRYFDASGLPSPGTKIGPYLIGDILGRGGMGVVFEATDQRLDRRVAIKMLAVEIAKRHDLIERFEREARAVAAISHPNIVELFDVGLFTGLPYAVMEHLDGELLDVHLKQGPMSAQEVRRLGAQIADALATAHDAGVVHRDLKPHNIMLVRRTGGEIAATADQDGQAASRIIKLFDFGLSRAPRDDLDDAEPAAAGTIMGTPGYMAPEQARGEPVTAAADIFSLGCVLYEAFYGNRAFDGPTKLARYNATLEHEPQPDPIRRREDVELADLIQQCLSKSIEGRPPSAAIIAKRLRAGLQERLEIAAAADSRQLAGQLARRQFLTMAGGGLIGAVGGYLLDHSTAHELRDIRSLAVLSFSEDSTPPAKVTTTPKPIGEDELGRGDQLSALLVHELTRLSELSVPPFRPVRAETREEFRQLGAALEVDALLTGTIDSSTQGATEFLQLDLKIVSSKTGNQLWGKTFQSDAGESLLQQTRLATQIASAIGQRLTSTADEAAPPTVESFSCLVDGQTRSDPDSRSGLEMALMCFESAHAADRRFADPIAGIALTSITLAAQTTTPRGQELVQQARQRAAEALQLNPASIEARLALAMLDWQTVGRFEQADRAFRELVTTAPDHWQVRHQYGLLQLATDRPIEAAQSLREAAQLNPMSVIVKVDRARAAWLSGNQERAIQDATLIRERHDENLHPRGLLVDIYESQAKFAAAAKLHENFELPLGATEQDYYQRRSERLVELPYGPFGDAINAAILRARTTGIDDQALAELTDPMPPMLIFVLATHPSFSAARSLPRAQEILPEKES